MVGAHLGFIEQRMPVLFVPHPGQRSQRLGCQEKRDLRTRQRCGRPFPQPPRLGASHGTLTRAHVVLVRAPDLAEVSVHALRDVIDLVWHQLGSGRRTILGGPLLAGENMVSHLLMPLASQDSHTCGTGCPAREGGRAGWADGRGRSRLGAACGHTGTRAPGILQGERGLVHGVVIDGSGPQHGRPARGACRQAGPVDELLVSLRLAKEQKAQAATTDRQHEVGGGRVRDLELEAALLEQLRRARALGRGRAQEQARHRRSGDGEGKTCFQQSK